MDDMEEQEQSGMVATVMGGTEDWEDLGRQQSQDDCMGLCF